MTTQALTVNFNSTDLFIVDHNGQPYTPMKQIVEGMGIDWAAQYVKLKSNEQRWGIVKIAIPTLGDIQEMICLPLRKLNGWLMTIHPNKVKPELRETIIKYQNECDDVLWDYWQSKHQPFGNPEQLPTIPEPLTKLAYQNGLTLSDQDIIKTAVKQRAESLPKEKWKGATIKMWSSIKAKYGCNYKMIAPDQTAAILSLIARMDFEDETLEIPKKELEAFFQDKIAALPKPEERPKDTILFNLSQPAVNQVMLKFEGNSSDYNRWFVNQDGANVLLKKLPDNAMPLTFEQWIEYAIKERGYVVLPKNMVLAKLAA